MTRKLALLILIVLCAQGVWAQSGTANFGTLTSAAAIGAVGPVINVKSPVYNAQGNARSVTDGVTSTATITSATAAFTQADVGKGIWAFTPSTNGLGTLRIATGTKIVSVQSATSATINPAAASNANTLTFIIGVDDTAALTAAAAAAKPQGTVYMPCGNYMVTVIPYNIDTTWTNLTIRGEGYGCVNMWFSQDFTTDGSGGGQIIRFTPTLGNLEEITVDGLGNAPAAIANKRLVGMGSEGGIRNFRVQNWEPPTGFNNTCLVTTSDRLVAYHPLVSCNSIGAWQIQSLGTDIYDPEISGGEFGINFTEQGGRMFGGRVNAGNQATHAVMTSTCCGPSVNDIFIFGTHVACSSVTCFGFDLTASGNTLHLIGVDCAIFQNQSNIANMGCVKTAAGSTAYISNSILYARSTSTIFNNSGTIIDAGGNTISADSNGAFYTGAGVYVGVSTTNNCAAVGTAASPSVAACGSAAAGSFSCATNATGATCQINTTAVTANSVIMVEENDTTAQGTKLGVTCNTSTTVNPATRLIASQTAGTGFVINLGTVTTNPACFNYTIVN